MCIYIYDAALPGPPPPPNGYGYTGAMFAAHPCEWGGGGGGGSSSSS